MIFYHLSVFDIWIREVILIREVISPEGEQFSDILPSQCI